MNPEQFSPDSTLAPQQHIVLNLIAQGASITEAASAAGVHRNTVGNWRRTCPNFAREFEFAGRERALYWHDQATALAPQAIDILSTILHNENASPSLRFRAATKVLAMAADPKPEPLQPFPASAAQLEAVDGRTMLLQSLLQSRNALPAEPAQPAQSAQPLISAPEPTAKFLMPVPAQSCTTPPSQPVRRPPEPGRNTPCPCGSGLKFKRCCALKSSLAARAA